MSELTPSEIAILGLFADQPRHGYELDEVIDARGLREWSEIGFSSIYFLLQKLARKGCIRQQGRAAGAKARKRYAITAQGRAALAASSLRLLAEPRRPHAPLLVGLSNWPALDPATAVAALGARRTALAAEIARIGSARQARAPLPRIAQCMFDYGIALARAELAWLEATIPALEATVGQARPQDR